MAGPIILPSSTASAGLTLLEYVRPIADQLGSRNTLTVSSSGTTGERNRLVFLDGLQQDDADADVYDDSWLYVLDGDQAGTQLQCIRDGFVGPLGAVLVSPSLPAPLAPGTQVEMTSPLPVRRNGTIKGLVDLANEAGVRSWIEARLQLTGNGTRLYDLSATPWLRRFDQTNGLYTWWGQSSTTTPSILSVAPYAIKTNGAAATLETSVFYGSAVPFELAVFVEANRLVKHGASWDYVTAGFVDDSDQGAVPIEWLLPIAVLKGLQYLTRMVLSNRKIPKDEKSAMLQEIGQRRALWAVAAATVVEECLPRPLPTLVDSFAGSAQVATYDTYPPEVSTVPVASVP